jgi:hypothetical protein
MKRIIFIILILTISFAVNSQIKRGISPYRFNPDMYIGANIGPNAFLGDGFSEYGLNGAIGLSESIYLGYNIIEVLGVRVLGSFSDMNWPGILSNSQYQKKNFSTISMSFEVLFNLSNYFDIYNLNRPFDFSIFAGTGFIAREKANFQNEFLGLVYKGGIQAAYRLNYKFELNASITGNIVGEQFNEYATGRKFDAFPEIMVGLTYHIRSGSNFR